MTEDQVAQAHLVKVSQLGWRLWRNNSGAFVDKAGRWVRYGLGNISTAANKMYKSADYIGIRPVLITQDMVGQTIGQFVSVEYKGTHGKVDPAQIAWAKLVRSLGGYAEINNTGNL
jgi:hypothetical protein